MARGRPTVGGVLCHPKPPSDRRVFSGPNGNSSALGLPGAVAPIRGLPPEPIAPESLAPERKRESGLIARPVRSFGAFRP